MNRPRLDAATSSSVEPARARHGVVSFVVGALCGLVLDPVTPLEEPAGEVRA